MISIKRTPIDALYAILSTVLNMVTLGDLCDLKRSIKRFHLLQPSLLLRTYRDDFDESGTVPRARYDFISYFEHDDLG